MQRVAALEHPGRTPENAKGRRIPACLPFEISLKLSILAPDLGDPNLELHQQLFVLSIPQLHLLCQSLLHDEVRQERSLECSVRYAADTRFS